MSITSINSTPLGAQGLVSTPNAAMVSAAKTQQDFMQLLVAQMQNQDPTHPMTSSDMTAQVSQINMVNGINQLNSTLSDMAGIQKSSEAMQAASLIGHDVLVPGNSLQLNNGTAQMGLQLKQAADDVQVNILDSTGAVISSQDLGAQNSGLLNLSWDGTTNTGMAPSNPPYSFIVSASQAGRPVPDSAMTPLAVATVNNIAMAGGVTSLNVTTAGNAANNVAISAIYEVNN